MKEEFIPMPNYGVCSRCKKKVGLPKLDPERITDTELTPILKRIRKKDPEIIVYKCPHCGIKMRHIIAKYKPMLP